MTKNRVKWSDHVENTARPNLPENFDSNDIHLTFINHVTFLIQSMGLTILTDPVFSLRTSPSQLIGPQRVRRPGVELEDLPKIDVVLISHNHYDHMDENSLIYLNNKFHPRFVVPLGNAEWLQKFGIEHKSIIEKDWWDFTEFENRVRVHLTPAQHWSGRWLNDRNQSLWCGLIIEFADRKVYFAGDSGYADHFSKIREKFGPMDLALLPIGAYEPRWFMRDQHMNPDDAVRAHLDLESRKSIGTHFGTFQLTDEGIDDPVTALDFAKRKFNVDSFHVLEVGQTSKY